MEDKFIVFEQYGLVVKKAIENVVHDYNMGNVDPPNIIYATPPVAFAKFSQNTVNGEDPGPLISFYLSSIEINPEEQIGAYKTILINKTYRYRAPIVAKLNYTITINAVKEDQADLLESQIIMAMPFNRPYATTLNGQWVTMEAKDNENETSIEIETDADKISKRTCKIEIYRAYFDYPIQVNSKFINSINSHIYSVEKNKVVVSEDL